MKVLAVLVGTATRTGGPPAFVGGSALELAALGTSMRVLATDLALAPWGLLQTQRRIQPEDMHPALAKADTQLFPARFPRRLAYSPALARALRETVSAFDVVHIHNLWQFPQYIAYRAAIDAGVPYVVSPHGSLDPYLRRHGRVRKYVTTALWHGEMLSRASLMHVTTEAERELVADVAPEVPRAVVPCGLYTDEFATLPRENDFRRRWLESYGGPIILFLGRITQKKGVDVLIRAFAQVRKKQECRLVIAGPDDEGLSPRLRRLTEDLGVQRDVAFTDAIYGEDRLAALSEADIWALSSHTENFGIAVVEAMAAGCAVVISRGVNLSADVESEQAGLVTDATPDAFAEALSTALADDHLRGELERRAREFAARYDWREVAPRLNDLYRMAVDTAYLAGGRFQMDR